jgi:two-component system NarL family sensor kinase
MQPADHRSDATAGDPRRTDALDALRERAEQFQHLFEASGDGLVVVEPDSGRILSANAALYAMHGLLLDGQAGASGALVGEPWCSFVHPEHRARWETAIPGVLASGSDLIDIQVLRADGSPFHVQVRLTRFTYEGRPAILGVLRDVTERVQTVEQLEQRVTERTRELSTLLKVARNVASTLELEPLLQIICEQAKLAVDNIGASIYLRDGNELVLLASELTPERVGRRYPLEFFGLLWESVNRGEPVVVNDIYGPGKVAEAYRTIVLDRPGSGFENVRSWMAVPLKVKDRVIGGLTMSHTRTDAFSDEHATLALAFASQTAIAIENARLYDQAQALAVAEERNRLAREIHDTIAQGLVGIILHLEAVDAYLPDDARLRRHVSRALALSRLNLDEARRSVRNLRASALDQRTLVDALRLLVAEHRQDAGCEVVVTLPADLPRLAPAVEAALYRIAQESLTNCRKHARAATVWLELALDGGSLRLSIADDGVGFDIDTWRRIGGSGTFGLHGMDERVRQLGGELLLEPRLGGGTRLTVVIPLEALTRD